LLLITGDFMASVWKATQDVLQLISDVKEKNHHPRLEHASIVACFEDSKPFVKNKLNLGKVSKFSNFSKIWQKENSDFCFCIPLDLWKDILKKDSQREAYIDLLLSRCDMEFMPEVVEENGKKQKIKDEWGRVKYTNEPKLDAEGQNKWVVLPLDLEVFTENVRRCGLWLDQLLDLKDAIKESEEEA
jgi:hypothetical protein